MKTNNQELTEQEIKMIKLMNDNSGNDCFSDFSENEKNVPCWFGFFDSDFKKSAEAVGILGKTISGLAGSLVKKGIVLVYLSDYGEPNEKTGKCKIVKAFQIRMSATEEINEYLKNKKGI